MSDKNKIEKVDLHDSIVWGNGEDAKHRFHTRLKVLIQYYQQEGVFFPRVIALLTSVFGNAKKRIIEFKSEESANQLQQDKGLSDQALSEAAAIEEEASSSNTLER